MRPYLLLSLFGPGIWVYDTTLNSIFMYGLEYWSLSSRTASKLQAAEIKVLRTVRGVTRESRLKLGR